jgi:transposase InsO family protein
MDRGSKFVAEVRKMLNKEYPIKRKLITTRNPQANAVMERIHQVVHNMIHVQAISGKKDVKETYKLEGVLAVGVSAVLETQYLQE